MQGIDPGNYGIFMEQIALNRQLLYMTWALMFLICSLLVLQIFRHIRRFTGLKSANINGNYDPLDDVTLGQFRARMDEHDAKVMKIADRLEESLFQNTDRRFNAIDKQLASTRRKDNIMLIILRDLRSFMIYGERPITRDLPNIEEDEDDHDQP